MASPIDTLRSSPRAPFVEPPTPRARRSAPIVPAFDAAASAYGQQTGRASTTSGPAQLAQLVAKDFEVSPEQQRFERMMRTDTKLFVNPTKSRTNCSECAIALDRRFGGDMSAVARDEAVSAHGGDPIVGMLAELERPEVHAKLIGDDEPDPQLAALRAGDITFADLRAGGRAKIEAAIETLRSTDFTEDSTTAERAVAEVAALPHVVLMGRHNAEDYSIQEVARRLGRPSEDIEQFASKESGLWAQIPLFDVEGFNAKQLIPVARRSGVADALGKRIRAMKTNERAVLSFLAVSPDGHVHAHLLNVVKPNTTRPLPGGGTHTMGPDEFIVDGQLGHVYELDAFLRFTYPNLLYAELLPTGTELHDGKNLALFRTLRGGAIKTQEALRWAAW